MDDRALVAQPMVVLTVDRRALAIGILPIAALRLLALALIFLGPELATWLPARAHGR